MSLYITCRCSVLPLVRTVIIFVFASIMWTVPSSHFSLTAGLAFGSSFGAAWLAATGRVNALPTKHYDDKQTASHQALLENRIGNHFCGSLVNSTLTSTPEVLIAGRLSILGQTVGATGRRENSMYFAVSSATARPPIDSTTSSAMSMPADTPADVTISSSTTRQSRWTLTLGSMSPSRSRRAPVGRGAPVRQQAGPREEQRSRADGVRYHASPEVWAIQWSTPTFSSSARVPNPPGMTIRSMYGTEAKS